MFWFAPCPVHAGGGPKAVHDVWKCGLRRGTVVTESNHKFDAPVPSFLWLEARASR